MQALGVGLIIALVLVICSEAHHNHPEKNDWESYKAFHGKTFHNSTHEKKHRKTFEKNARKIAAHNKLFQKGLVSYEKELNSFTDEDDATLQQRRGYKKSDNLLIPESTSRLSPLGRAAALPASFDWRNYNGVNYVSPIKDQGQCGCCWAFSATGALESQVYIKNQPSTARPVFSEQQLVDCDTYDNACGGGNYANAWYYIYANGGIETEASYPFVANVTLARGTCGYTATKAAQKVTNYYILPQNETVIQQYLVSVGPLSIALDATNLSPYSSGIYDCPSNWSLDHAVLIVGYGTSSSGVPYWIVKNQWGPGWGLNGYFYLKRGTNACGMNSEAAYPAI